MSLLWSITIIAIGISWMAALIKPQTYAKGKYITMPMRKRWPRMFNHGLCRLYQIGLLFFISLAVTPFWSSFVYIYMAGMTAMPVDDYFTDEDNWKKFKEWAKNKIKWKMELPKPVRIES